MQIVHTVVLFAIVLGILVLIHELGHFVMAKLCKVKVEIFSIGFGPRIVGFRVGDTDYRISALPLGGYVKMFGDNPGERPRDRETLDILGIDINAPGEFNGRPRWQRVLIALSGLFANFILSFFLLFFVAHYHYEVPAYLSGPAVVDYVPQSSTLAHAGMSAGDTIVKFAQDTNPDWERVINDCLLNLNSDVPITFDHHGQLHSGVLHVISSGNTSVTADPLDLTAMGIIPAEQPGPISVTEVDGGTPADRAGLTAGDLIEAVDNFQPHSVPALLAYLRDRNGAPVVLDIYRNGQTLTLHAQPEQMSVPNAATQYRLGFQYKSPPVQVQRLPIGRAIVQSAKDNWDSSTLVLRIIQGLFTRHVSVKTVSGPVGIAQQIELVSQQGIWPLVGFMAMISIQPGHLQLAAHPHPRWRNDPVPADRIHHPPRRQRSPQGTHLPGRLRLHHPARGLCFLQRHHPHAPLIQMRFYILNVSS